MHHEGLKRAADGCLQMWMRKIAKNSPFGHHCTCMDNRKKTC